MAYRFSKGHQIIGDLSGSDDSNRNTGIDFEEDYIGLITSGSTRFRISGSSGEIRFNESFSFPTVDGNANQVLKTNGSGQLSWADQSGGGGGGSTNSFQTISVSGQSDVVADSSTDTLTLVAGSNITLTTNAGSDQISIAAASEVRAPTIRRCYFSARAGGIDPAGGTATGAPNIASYGIALTYSRLQSEHSYLFIEGANLETSFDISIYQQSNENSMTYTVQDILSSIPWATDSTLLPYYWSSDNNTWIVMLPTLATSATPSYSVKTLSGSTESTVSVSSSLHYDHGRVAVPINFENLIDSNYLRLKIKNNQTESPLYIELSPAAYTYTNEEQFSSGVGEPAVQGDGTWTPNSGKTVFLHSNKMAMMVTPSGASTNYWKAQGGVLAEGKLLKDTDSGVTYSTRLHVQCANVTGLSYTVGVADGDLIVAGEAFHGGRNIATVIKANEAHSSDRYDVKLGVMFYKLSSTSVRIRAVVWLDGKRVYTSEDPYTISSSHIHTAGSSPNLNNLAYISVSVLANANQTVLADGDYKWSTMATSDAILD